MAENVDALYLSPHLDDVALSCPARLRDEREAGRRVVVFSFFSRGDASHDARKREDALALKLLDVEGEYAELLDAPFRSPKYRSLATLCLERVAVDDAETSAVQRALAEALDRFHPTSVVAPLGVGGHVDHRLVHAAARVTVLPEQLAFYEDRPYALVPGAVERRLCELGADVAAPSTGEFLRSFLRAPYVRSFLRPRDLIPLARHLRRAEPPTDPVSWRAEVERHPRGERGVAMAAGLVYASQWKDLFGTLGDHERLLRESAERLGAPDAYAERFWRVG